MEGVARAERRSCSNVKRRGGRFGRRAQRTQPERSEAKGEETPQAAATGGGSGGGVCMCVCGGGWSVGTAWVAASPAAAPGADGIPATPTVEAPQAEPFHSPVALSQCSEPWNLRFKRCVEVLVVHNNMHGATRSLKLSGLVKFVESPTRYIGLNHC